MPTVWKGGPGARAPYKTTHIRIPEPLKPQVQEMIDNYRRQVLADFPATLPPAPPASETETPLEAALTLLKESLTLKANAGGAIKQKIRQALALLSPPD